MNTSPDSAASRAAPSGQPFGIDLGGTKLAAGSLDGNFQVMPTPGSAEAIVQAIEAAAPGGGALGLCAAGRVDPARGTLAVNIPQLQDFPLVARLARGGRRVLLINDADAAALAEHHLGAASGAGSSLYVTVSTGIGAGLVVGGRLYRGARGQALELGHVRAAGPGAGDAPWGAPWDAPCPCGRLGCTELYASGTAITRSARRALGDPEALPETLAALARAGDGRVLGAVERAATVLAGVLADACVLLDPEVVVLGGGAVQGYGELFLAPLRNAFGASLGGGREGAVWAVPELRAAQLGGRAGVLGALLALDAAPNARWPRDGG